MALTDDQTAFFDAWLGPDTWVESDLEARVARTGNDAYAAWEVLSGRLATFEAQPASLTIPQEYAQKTDVNITALQKKLDELPRPPLPGGGTGGAPARIVYPTRSGWRR